MATSIPFDQVIWDAQDCAAYLRIEKASFLKRTQYAEGFPARLAIPGHPRWAAHQVTEWAFSRQNHEQAA